MKTEPFRRTVRIKRIDSLDEALIEFLEGLEQKSAYVLQEWMRSALRKTYLEQSLATLNVNQHEVMNSTEGAEAMFMSQIQAFLLQNKQLGVKQ